MIHSHVNQRQTIFDSVVRFGGDSQAFEAYSRLTGPGSSWRCPSSVGCRPGGLGARLSAFDAVWQVIKGVRCCTDRETRSLYSKQHIVPGLDLVAQYVVPYRQKVRGRRRIASLSEIVQHIVVVTVLSWTKAFTCLAAS